jgi:hypothetical protein
MKKLYALLVAVALFTPAFVRNAKPQVIEKKPVPAIQHMTVKPVLLHTGKPLTAQEKLQQLASLTKKSPQLIRVSTTPTITPGNMFIPGVVIPRAMGAFIVDFNPGGVVQFNPGSASNLILTIGAQPNTAYMLAITVSSTAANPQYTAETGVMNMTIPGLNTVPETFTGSKGNTEFAYAFISSGSTGIPVTIYSPNAMWSFVKCEITSAPMN